MAERHFTLDEATSLLPWLRTVLSRIRDLQEQIQQAGQERRGLLGKVHHNGSQDLSPAIHANLDPSLALEKGVADQLQPVLARGIIVRDPARGLVDFPTLRDGREVHLCWVLGEDEIRHWHETDAGFSGRQPL
ncbi:MAG: DUF2203 family protein [Dehalococcoidia bacterium]|nr:DUF2203 family protein [Dehalococcoidia bacterium]